MSVKEEKEYYIETIQDLIDVLRTNNISKQQTICYYDDDTNMLIHGIRLQLNYKMMPNYKPCLLIKK